MEIFIRRLEVSKYFLVTAFLFATLTVGAVNANCSGRRNCGRAATSNALERYNRYIATISKHRRSVATRHRENHASRKRSTIASYQYAKSIKYKSAPVLIAPPSHTQIKSAYTTIQRKLLDEERTKAMRKRKIRLMQARQLQILQRIRQVNQKPWWGQWSSWSACGRTCGCGVQFQDRHCLGARYVTTHQNGKTSCIGPIRRYKICNTAPCPTNSPSFRRLQCSQHASKEVRGKYYTWKPYGHPVDEIVSNEPCQLVCVSNVNEVQMNTVAMDGTECRRGWNDGRCVDGKCQLIGCDGKINSTKLRDKCGKCEEDGTSCVVHHDAPSQNFPSAGEYKFIRIPEGAYDILINERRKTSASLVVKDDNGTMLFNGGGESSSGRGTEGWPSNVEIAGAEFRYRRPILHSSSEGFEYLLSTGPTNAAIVVYLHATRRGHTMLHYEFKTPIPKEEGKETSMSYHEEDENSTSSSHVPSYSTTTSTSETPFTAATPANTTDLYVLGLKTPLQQHSIKQKVVLTRQWADDDATNVNSAPPVKEYEFVGEDDENLVDQEEDFLLIREIDNVPVMREEDNPIQGNATDDSLTKNEENSLVFFKPKFELADGEERKLSENEPDSVEIIQLEQINDTETIARVYTVERKMTGDNETDEDVPGDGDGTPKEGGEDYDIAPGVDIPIPIGNGHKRRYEPRSYLGYHWRTNGFAPCSSTCRSGLQDSYAVCERIKDHLSVDDSYCDPTTRPEPVRRSCSNQTCEPRWEATPWSECSLSCGTGVRMRTVRCWKMIGPGFDSTLYNEVCDDVEREKPAETKPCKIVDHCGPLWETSDWSSCPAPCGRVAIKLRTVRCSGVHDRLCSAAPKPHTEERCFGPKCVLKWIVTDWSPCFGVCGGGRKTRRVICGDNTGRGHPEDQCDLSVKPATSHPCGDVNCKPEWIAQDWEECTAECGEGVRIRKVLCSGIVNGEVHHCEDDIPCSATPKPPTREPCQLKVCDPVWFTTSWSKCSVTCGSGNRVREVKCYLRNAPATGCKASQKPPQTEPCNMPACPVPRPEQCRNKPSVNCALVVRVRLCSHWYYRKACCSSCQPRRTKGK